MRTRSAYSLFACVGVCCLLVLPGCRRMSSSRVEGSYRTVSESEWEVTLTLKRGGVAEIQQDSWAPGEYETRSSDKTVGRWRFDGRTITVEYNGIKDQLIYDSALSLSILGFKGGAPGLIQITAFDENSRLRDYPFWSLPHKFGQTPEPR